MSQTSDTAMTDRHRLFSKAQPNIQAV